MAKKKPRKPKKHSANIGWLWMSFVDPTKPHGERFLGVSIVRARGVIEGANLAWKLGCNPGGQVLAMDLDYIPPIEYCNRLLTREEAEIVKASVLSEN